MTINELNALTNQNFLKSYDFKKELSLMNDQQIRHLEKEFEDFDKEFPKE